MKSIKEEIEKDIRNKKERTKMTYIRVLKNIFFNLRKYINYIFVQFVF